MQFLQTTFSGSQLTVIKTRQKHEILFSGKRNTSLIFCCFFTLAEFGSIQQAAA